MAVTRPSNGDKLRIMLNTDTDIRRDLKKRLACSGILCDRRSKGRIDAQWGFFNQTD